MQMCKMGIPPYFFAYWGVVQKEITAHELVVSLDKERTTS